jgi:hypothetical protein
MTGLPEAVASRATPFTAVGPAVVGDTGLLLFLLQLDIQIPMPTTNRNETRNRAERRMWVIIEAPLYGYGIL